LFLFPRASSIGADRDEMVRIEREGIILIRNNNNEKNNPPVWGVHDVGLSLVE
jgi:hypothetical protein